MRPAGFLVWREIENAIAAQIEGGEFAADAKLPTEGELAESFRVNRHTIRRALAALRDRGLISIQQGRGTFVRSPMIEYPISQRTRFNENISRQSRTATSRVLNVSEEKATARIAEDLDLSVGAACVVVEDMREIEGRVVNLNKRYFPASRFAGIGAAIAETQSISAAVRRFGVNDFVRRRTRIHARGAEVAEAERLGISVHAPLLVVEAVNVDLDGVPIESNSSRSAGGVFQLIIDSQ